jgi:hypothetical protein
MTNEMPKLYPEQKLTLNSIRRYLGLDKMYLYRFIGNYERIEKMPYSIVLGIAKLEKIEPNKLYSKMLTYALQNSKNKVE